MDYLPIRPDTRRSECGLPLSKISSDNMNKPVVLTLLGKIMVKRKSYISGTK